jgi:predicted porin
VKSRIIFLMVAGLFSGTVAAAEETGLGKYGVTLYGVLDGAWVKASATGRRGDDGLVSGGLAASRLGFNFSDEIDDGLRFIAKLEYQLDVESNASIGTANPGVNSAGTLSRQQILGLTGAWGTVVTGYMQTASYEFAAKYDVPTGSAFSPLQNLVKGHGGFLIGAGAGATRTSGALGYTSPSLAGFTVTANHAHLTQTAISDVDGTNTDKTATLLFVNYVDGPLSAGVIGAHVRDPAAAAWLRDDWAVGASYNFEVVTFKAVYQSTATNAEGTAGKANTIACLGASIPAGTGSVMLSYAESDIGTAENAGASGYAVAYLYTGFKRTTLYAAYNRMENESAARIGVINSLVTPTTGGGNADLYVLGLNYRF